ncbi:MAG TPA: hypothetical protein VE981_21360 [Planctomycetota bacterium]|nr:hypothetical protein [Planctomycetota bacterium]
MHPLLAFTAALLALALPAGETEYDYWANHKAGSWVKLKMEVDTNGVKVSVDAHHILSELAGDKVVVERKTKVTAAGMEQPESSEKEEIFKGKDKEPVKIEKEGDEEIEVGGKKVQCHWIQGTQKETHKVKFWISKQIPGGMAKAEVEGGDIPAPMKIVATSWESK